MAVHFAVLIVAMVAQQALPATSAVETSEVVRPAAAETSRRNIIDHINALVDRHLARAEARPALKAALQAQLAAGRYDRLEDRDFAAKVTEDMQAVSGDKHIFLLHDPARQVALSADGRPSNVVNTSTSGPMAARFRERNFGLVEQRILGGNVRYLKIESFSWLGDVSSHAYDNAVEFLEGGDAIIIDTRDNPGGFPEAARYLISSFAQPNELIATFYQAGAQSELRASPAARRLPAAPLYVLVNATTGSAAEAFAYYVGSRNLAEIVGEPTAGAGNIKEEFGVPPGFVLSVSVAEAVDPLTRSNWEGIGVSPTVRVDAGRALQVAHVLALERLTAGAKPSERRRVSLALRVARAEADPILVPQAQLAAYTGLYGDRRVTIGADGLYWKRGDQAPLRLTPLGDHWFLIGDSGMQAKFSLANERAVGVSISRADGDSALIPRNTP